jgi:hypothetical protein
VFNANCGESLLPVGAETGYTASGDTLVIYAQVALGVYVGITYQRNDSQSP